MAQPPGLSGSVSSGLGAIPELHHVHPDTVPAVVSPTRTGLAHGTRLATARGLITVEQLVPGDTVSFEDGQRAPVVAVVPLGLQPTVRLRVRGGYELVATPAQMLRGLDAQGNDVWRSLADLRRGDVVVLQPGRWLPPDLPFVPPAPVSLPPWQQPQTFTNAAGGR